MRWAPAAAAPRQLTLQLARKGGGARQAGAERALDRLRLRLRLAGRGAQTDRAGERQALYAVLLQRVPAGEGDKLLPIPLRFQNLESISTTTTIGGVEMLEVSVGYFATEAEAESVRRAALQRFPQAAIVDLAQRKQETLQAAAAATPLRPRHRPRRHRPPRRGGSRAQPPPVLASRRSKRAAAPDDQRPRGADGPEYEAAVNAFNQLLLLPPNSQSRDAQELIGLAWSRPVRRRAPRPVHELYLRLFPQGEGRSAWRSASPRWTSARPPAPALRQAGAPASAASEPSRYNGSISQYYFGGRRARSRW